jgi:regulator of protease activity HflC (stomatin/prohibitin superfamily)
MVISKILINMKNLETEFSAYSGYILVFIQILFLLGIGFYIFNYPIHWFVYLPLICIWITFMVGFITLEPNMACVLILFGEYKGTLRKNGFFWVNPFFSKKTISLRARNIDGKTIKVNDKIGNPIEIGSVLVWKIENTYKAEFEVENLQNFVEVQSDAALRKLAGAFPYDNFDEHEHELTLRSGGKEINELLEKELKERLDIAGIEVLEARLNHLAYASEIASAMLQRQQAVAVVAARQKIVEGAVGMVESALHELSRKKIIELDDDKKAAMVSNLLVVLCANNSTQPIVNAGSTN